MLRLIAEVTRYATFLNHRPNIDELLTRLSTDFLNHLDPKKLAVAAFVTNNRFKVLHQNGDSKSDSELTLQDLQKDFMTENLVATLMDQSLVRHPNNQKSLIAPISNGKVAAGVVLCECNKKPDDEETEQEQQDVDHRRQLHGDRRGLAVGEFHPCWRLDPLHVLALSAKRGRNRHGITLAAPRLRGRSLE